MSSVPKDPIIKWLAGIGDSLTNSDMSLYIPKSQEYPKLLQNTIGGNCRSRNMGVPGNTSGAALARLNDFLRYPPTVSIIYLGINDKLSSVPTGTMTANILSIVQGLQAVGCSRFIICNIHNTLDGVDYSAYRTALSSFASTNGFAFCDFSAISLVSGDFFPDNLHLQASGHVKMANALKATLDAKGWTSILQN
jgi:lysophospholipase L1-like esterase